METLKERVISREQCLLIKDRIGQDPALLVRAMDSLSCWHTEDYRRFLMMRVKAEDILDDHGNMIWNPDRPIYLKCTDDFLNDLCDILE